MPRIASRRVELTLASVLVSRIDRAVAEMGYSNRAHLCSVAIVEYMDRISAARGEAYTSRAALRQAQHYIDTTDARRAAEREIEKIESARPIVKAFAELHQELGGSRGKRARDK